MSAAAIYDTIGDFFGWRQMPKTWPGVFFGFTGTTRAALERLIEKLRANGGAWLTLEKSARDSVFTDVSSENAAATGADIDGCIKFCNWCLVAARGVPAVNAYFGGADYSRAQYVIDTIQTGLTSTAAAAADTIEYGINYETEAEKTLKSGLLPVLGILAACFLVKKVLD